MSRGGGASLTTYSEGAALCAAYGTTDVAEAVAAEMRGLTKDEILENTVKELRSMEAKCKKCGNLFTYDGRKVKQTPDNCEECGQAPAEPIKGFNPVERPEPGITRVDKPPVKELPDNLCDTCGNADYSSYEDEDVCRESGAPLHGIVTSCKWYTAEAPLVQEIPIAPAPTNGQVTVSDLEEVLTEFTNGEEDQYPFAAMVWGYLRGRGVAA